MSKLKNNSNQELVDKQNATLKQYAEQLSKLQTDIAAKETLCLEHGKITLKLAHQAGNILIEAQKLVPHGNWEDWVMENVKGIKLRTAQNYMKLAYEINHREEIIQARTKDGGKTQLVSLLDEVQNLREAYRVIGVIKNGFRNTDSTDSTEKATSPAAVKKDNPILYEETLATVREEMLAVIQEILKENPEATWDVSQWTVDANNKPPFRDKGTARCLNKLVECIAGRGYSDKITHADEIGYKAGAVFRELFKAIIQASRVPTPEAQKPEEFFMEFGDNSKAPVEVAEKMAA